MLQALFRWRSAELKGEITLRSVVALTNVSPLMRCIASICSFFSRSCRNEALQISHSIVLVFSGLAAVSCSCGRKTIP